MKTIFTCPHCGEETLISDEFAGQTGPCRHCGEMVTVTRLFSKENSGVNPLAVTGAFLRWCNRYLGYVVLGIFAVGVLNVLLAPEFDGTRQIARRMTSANSLKQIALALHIYHDTYRHFPRPFCVTPNGERTLSWRVSIMPFMEHSPFLDRFHSDEAWNSAANRELASDYVHPYQGQWNKHRLSAETGYLVITGPGTLFEEHADHGINDCTDGAANTILVVEVKHSDIEWTEPRDLDIRTMIMQINASDSNGISGPWKEGAQVAMADGSVRLLSKDLLESTLRAMITRNGGEAIESPE